MKRLKRAQFLDGIMKDGEMQEIYVNPTSTEFSRLEKTNEFGAVRITIASDGTVYVWNGLIHHGAIGRSHPECENGFHAVYMRDGNELTIYPSGKDSLNDVLGYFSISQSFMQQNGIANAKLDIFTADYGGTKFPEYKDWKNVTDIYNFIDNM